jgi:hypothetical protein
VVIIYDQYITRWSGRTTPRRAHAGLSLASYLQLTPKLQLALGNYVTIWKVNLGLEDPALIAANTGSSLVSVPISVLRRSPLGSTARRPQLYCKNLVK